MASHKRYGYVLPLPPARFSRNTEPEDLTRFEDSSLRSFKPHLNSAQRPTNAILFGGFKIRNSAWFNMDFHI